MEERKMKAVYSIIEKPNGAKPYWMKLGIGFVNRDGSINLKLDAFPTSPALHIRDFEPKEETRSPEGNLFARPNSALSSGLRPHEGAVA